MSPPLYTGRREHASRGPSQNSTSRMLDNRSYRLHASACVSYFHKRCSTFLCSSYVCTPWHQRAFESSTPSPTCPKDIPASRGAQSWQPRIYPLSRKDSASLCRLLLSAAAAKVYTEFGVFQKLSATFAGALGKPYGPFSEASSDVESFLGFLGICEMLHGGSAELLACVVSGNPQFSV